MYKRQPVKEGAPGHGCGHNLLSIGGVQAAVALKKLMEEKDIKGTIRLFGTPAEEICVGKPFMAKAGLFEGLDAVVDWHPAHTNTSGYRDCLAYFNIKYHFKGKAVSYTHLEEVEAVEEATETAEVAEEAVAEPAEEAEAAEAETVEAEEEKAK